MGLAQIFALCVSAAAHAQEVRLAKADEDLEALLQSAARILNLPEDASRSDAVAAAQGDYARLVSVLYSDGFYGPSVSIKLNGREASTLSAFEPPAKITPVIVSIDQGQPFVFGRARIDPVPEGLELPEAFAEGRTARTGRIRAAAQIAVQGWRDASHAKAEITQSSIVARHGPSQVDVDIEIDPGPALRFGGLSVRGSEKVREDRIRDIAGFPVGEPYSPESLRKSRERLVSTGAFNAVVIREAETPNPDDTLDVILGLEDAPQRRLGFGGEVSTDEGLSAEAFWTHRNIFGGAERLRISFNIDGVQSTAQDDGVDYELGALLTIPAFRRPDDSLSIGISAERLDEPTYISDVLELGVIRAREFDDRRSASIGAGLRTAHTSDAFGTRDFRHLILSASGTFDGRDDSVAPRAGQYVNFEARPFIGFDGSESGARLFSDLSTYFGVGTNTVFAGRLQLGTVLGPSIEDTPPEFLFLSGGGGTVRGQDYESLGVELPAGRVGGRSFVGLSAEIRQSLGGSFGVVGFVDYGYVAGGSDFQDGEDHAGIGIGARYITSVGALRVDLATQATGKTASDLFLYIGLGEAF